VVGVVTSEGVVPAYSGKADRVEELPPAPVSISEYWRQEGDRLFDDKDLAGAL